MEGISNKPLGHTKSHKTHNRLISETITRLKWKRTKSKSAWKSWFMKPRRITLFHMSDKHKHTEKQTKPNFLWLFGLNWGALLHNFPTCKWRWASSSMATNLSTLKWIPGMLETPASKTLLEKHQSNGIFTWAPLCLCVWQTPNFKQSSLLLTSRLWESISLNTPLPWQLMLAGTERLLTAAESVSARPILICAPPHYHTLPEAHSGAHAHPSPPRTMSPPPIFPSQDCLSEGGTL